MKFSKIVGFIVVVCMLATMLPAVVFAADTPTVSVVSSVCCAGNTVRVPVEMENNTGIVSMLLKIGYDKEYLTLTGVEDGGILGESMHSDNYDADPYTLSWANDTSDDICTDDGIIATLIFDVREDAPEGIYDITIEKIECLDFDGNIVDFAAADGKVDIYQYIIGDVNGDGVVDTKDRMYLSRHLADWLGYDEIDERAANVNGDDILNTQDRMYLARHLAGWIGYENLVYPGTPEVPDTPDVPETPDMPTILETNSVDLFDLDSIPENFSGNFKYYNEEDRLVTVSAVNADVYINGVALADIANLNYYDTVSKLNRMSGTINFVLHDGATTTSDYNAIYIDASMPFVVDSVDNTRHIVYGKDIGTMDAIYFAEGVNYESHLYDATGWDMEWTDLQAGDVLLLQYTAKNDNTEIFNAKLVENTVSGMVVSISGFVDNGTRQVTVGDTTYSVSAVAEYYSSLRLADNVILYLDENDRVIYFEVVAADNYEYGYVIDTAAPVAGNFLSGYQVQIFTEDNEVKVFDFAKKIKFNDYSGLEIVGGPWGDGAVGANEIGYSTISGLIGTVVRYRLNANGDINAIYTATKRTTIPDEELEDNFTYDDYFSGRLSGYDPTDMRFGKYTISKDTIIFYVEDTSTAKGRKNAKIVNISVLSTDDMLDNAVLYDVDADYCINCILVSGTGSVIGGTHENATFVLNVSAAIDENGDDIYLVTGYKDLEVVTYTVEADVLNNTDDGYGSGNVTGYGDSEVVTDTIVDVTNTKSYSLDDDSSSDFVYVSNSDKIKELIGRLVVPRFYLDGTVRSFWSAGSVVPDGSIRFESEMIDKIDGGFLYTYDGDSYTQVGRVGANTNVYVYDTNKAATGRGHYQIDASDYLDWDEELGIYYGTAKGEYNLDVTAQLFYTDNDVVKDILYIIK